jgi:PPK2 family polyphosphate:nucleotide phosphotransferase
VASKPRKRAEVLEAMRAGPHLDLDRHRPDETFGWVRADAKAELALELAAVAELQKRLFAEHRRALLVVLQAMDAGGKDGVIRSVLTGINPAGVRVASFGAPTTTDLDHDYLWRIHHELPERGRIGVFNRSHYEDVLVVRVKELAPEDLWRSRYDSINDFERMLAREGTTIVKFFLHISKDSQMDRFRERLEREDKHYKFSANDVRERRNWDAYQDAYEEALNHTSTDWAPWYMVPADHKWYRNLVVARTVATVLEEMNPRWPEPEEDLERFAAEELDQLSSR